MDCERVPHGIQDRGRGAYRKVLVWSSQVGPDDVDSYPAPLNTLDLYGVRQTDETEQRLNAMIATLLPRKHAQEEVDLRKRGYPDCYAAQLGFPRSVRNPSGV